MFMRRSLTGRAQRRSRPSSFRNLSDRPFEDRTGETDSIDSEAMRSQADCENLFASGLCYEIIETVDLVGFLGPIKFT